MQKDAVYMSANIRATEIIATSANELLIKANKPLRVKQQRLIKA
jgi:hypothetical protein